MKILLAIDGSSYTKKMLAYLTTHDELFGASNDYTVLTVQPALPPRARAAVGKEVVNSYYAEETAKVMAPVAKFLSRHGISANSDWKVGPAGETIACRVRGCGTHSPPTVSVPAAFPVGPAGPGLARVRACASGR